MKVLIVDDEPLAREGVALRLAGEKDVEILGECENGSQAIKAIGSLEPDLVFLDIKMPKVGGFDVIHAVGSERMPLVIFLTAYDEHAVEAFRLNALDYLLKPIDRQRFKASLDKARGRLEQGRLAQQGARLDALLRQFGAAAPTEPPQAPRITLRSAGRVQFLSPGEIDWIESEGDYVSVHTRERSHLIRETMRDMERKLSAHGFQRIHRGAIVKLDKIRELAVTENGEYEVRLNDGTVLKLGRNYRDELFSRMKIGS